MKLNYIIITLFVFFLSISCKVNKNDTTNESKLSIWIGKDVVLVMDGDFLEYNLYKAEKENMEKAIKEIINNSWNNEASVYDVSFSKNRSMFLENNVDLSNSVKEMIINRNANISTTKWFIYDIDKVFMFYIFNYTYDFQTYSYWSTWDVINVWGLVELEEYILQLEEKIEIYREVPMELDD